MLFLHLLLAALSLMYVSCSRRDSRADLSCCTDDAGDAPAKDGAAQSTADADSSMGVAGRDAAAETACLTSFPPESGATRAELAGVVPSVRWIKKLVNGVGSVSGHLAMSERAVAVPLSNGVAIYQKSSGDVKVFSRPGAEIFDDVIVGSDGTFLIGGKGIYAVNEEAALAWALPLGAARPIANEFFMCRLAYSRSRQILVAVCNDGAMSGVQAGPDRQAVLWRQQLYTEGVFDVSLAPSYGASSLVHVPSPHQGAGTWVIDSASGRQLGTLASRDVISLLSSKGFLARASLATLTLLDRCGSRQWRSTEAQITQIPMVLGGPDERVFTLELDGSGERHLAMVSAATGERLAGPTASGTPVAAGADGTFFAVSCDNLSPTVVRADSPPSLVAYDSTLTEKWRVTLPVPPNQGTYACPRPAVALDRDGVMYMAVEADGTYLFAVQTKSPGLAPTPWALRFHDHSGSVWLD
jgi:outer membrane protein assembly factor BamB